MQTLSDEEAKGKDPNFLFDDLRKHVATGKAPFNFNLEIAQTGHILDNVTIPITEGRKKIRIAVQPVACECLVN